MCKNCDELVARVPGVKDLTVLDETDAGLEIHRHPTTAELLVAAAQRFDEDSEVRGLLMTVGHLMLAAPGVRERGLAVIEDAIETARTVAELVLIAHIRADSQEGAAN